MPIKVKIIWLSLFLGLSIWVIDAVLDYYFFYENNFIDILILNIPNHEIYIRLLILLAFFIFGLIISGTITKLHETNIQNQILLKELQSALADIKKLSGLLPICASCKKIRDDNGYWNHIESYIKDHSEADFSHSICPDCTKLLYPELEYE